MRIASNTAVTLPLLVLLLSATALQAAGASEALHSGGHGGRRGLQQASSANSDTAAAALRGESSLSPRLWPLPSGYLPMYRRVFRMVGRDIVRKRLAMEAGWHSWIAQTVEGYRGLGAGTMRFSNYVSNPSSTAGLEDLESVDETATVYIRSAREFGSLNLLPPVLAQASQDIEAAMQKAGVNATVMALYGVADQAPQVTAAQLAVGAIVTPAPDADLRVSARSTVEVSLPGGRVLPAAVDVQTALLLGLAEAAAKAKLVPEMLAFNVTRWERPSSGDTVTADIWYQFEGIALSVVPQAFWQEVAPVLPAATARHGLRMSAKLLNAESFWTTPNGTELDPSFVSPKEGNSTARQQRISAAAVADQTPVRLAMCIAIPVLAVAVLAVAFGVAQAYCKRQRLVTAAATAKALELANSSSSSGRSGGTTSGSGRSRQPLNNRICIDDGGGGCWVMFDTDDQGRRVLIGRGAFAKVYLGSRAGGQKVALKVLSATAQQAATLQRLRRETALLQRVSFDANVVQFYGASLQHAADAVLVMEYCAGGNLRQLLSSPGRRAALLWRAGGRRIALDAARGLNFLHSCRIVHRDMKSSNILLDASGRAKVADVGLACQLRTVDRGVNAAGTFVYLPPEVLLGIPAKGDAAAAAQAGDCYAFGVVLWELVTGEKPVRAHMRGVSTEGDHPECCDVTCALIEACLSSDIADRPTAAQLVAALEGLQGDAAEPESRPLSAQLVAALGQLQGDASGSFDKHMPAQHLGAATAVEAEPPAVTAAQGQGPKRIVSGSDQQPAAATSVRSGGLASK